MSYVTTWLQTNKTTKGFYKFAKKIIHGQGFSVKSLNEIKCVRSENNKARLNIVLPTVNKYKIFGGIATALQIYEMLAEEMNADVRIIVNRKEKYNEKYSLYKEGYSYNTGEGSKQFVFLTDTNNVLSVRENDIFMCTSWDTAYCFESVLQWKRKVFPEAENKMIYLIQDYEPGFYAWSTQYMLADSTYRSTETDVIAIFNSKQLYDFFVLNNYSFYKMLYFPPVLNRELEKYLRVAKETNKRKKNIIIYGRPNTERNAFSLIEHALYQWANTYENAGEWKIISLGETFEDIQLSDKVSIVCQGKVSLEEYAQTMLDSYIGVSLMVSPHPSYPPLEMTAFGVKTITNCFENKDLSGFSHNIISLERCTPEIICKKLIELCDQYPKQIAQIERDSDYVNNTNSLKNVIKEVASQFR